jgi:predicted transcriptional regulator
MEINEIVKLLDAEVICGHDRLSDKIASAFASDLMSDVLTLDTDRMMLITGLCNMQTIRTAEMADIHCILFVRGKKVPLDMREMANENRMVVLECKYSLFRTVGILYSHGMNPVY